MHCNIGNNWLSDAEDPPRYQVRNDSGPSAPGSICSRTESRSSASMKPMSVIASWGVTACLNSSGRASA